MQIKSKGYSVFFNSAGFDAFRQFLSEKSFSSVFILCDTNTEKVCLPVLTKVIPALKKVKRLRIPVGEKYKIMQTAIDCWDFLLENEADRQSLLVCLGGGVVCDMGAFVATTYKRGIPYVHIPTTLLAMADASVGGKNGLDFKGYKNVIGTISLPQAVFISDAFLKTLSQRHIANGMAEVIKAGLIGSLTLWKQLLKKERLTVPPFESIIQASVRVKNKIVSKDLAEKNIRKALNFGHTTGHAIESYFLTRRNPVLHGEAVAMGMCVELCLGKQLKCTQAKTAMEAFLFLRKRYVLRKFSGNEINAFARFMQQDKKNDKGGLNFSLIEKPGKALINIRATEQEVKQAFVLYNNLLA